MHSFIEKKIEEDLSNNFGPKTLLRKACAYALLGGGKRFRPLLVLQIAKQVGDLDATAAALAVEYFHTASLIADDLPCMDDDDKRRGKPSLHKAFGESTALLASYALISAGYRKIQENALGREALLAPALEVATTNTGILGITGGQYLDLFPPDHQQNTLLEILYRKTAALFEVSFCLGWLFGGGTIAAVDAIKKLAGHFGLAFQLADDLQDRDEHSLNFAKILGVKKAEELLIQEKSSFTSLAKELSLTLNF